MKWSEKVKGGTTIPLIVCIFLVVILVVAFLTIISNTTVNSSITLLEERGYVVLSASEYNTLNSKLDTLIAHDHSEQYVSPLGAPVSLTSGAGSYNLGDFSADILASDATSSPFDITAIGFGNPDNNGTYTVILYAGILDTEIGQVSFNRQGVFTSSIYRDMRTVILPTGTRIRAKMMDETGGSTCVTKIYYHYN